MWDVLFVCLVLAAASSMAAFAHAPGFGGFVVSVYVLAVADVVAVVEALSLIQAVSREALLVAQGGIALTAMLFAGTLRPGWPQTSGLTSAVRAVTGSRTLTAFACVVGVVWTYGALLALTAPANNWDSLTYHLARVASWFHEGGVYWIPHAPTDRLNEFQPNAEELILALVAVARAPWPVAFPQFVAGGAVMVSTGVSSRALGFSREASAFAMLIAGTVPMVVLQATTTQNDLITAALVGCAAALILQGGNRLLVVAGIAFGVAGGVKLTALLTIPVLILLAGLWGWRHLRTFCTASIVSLLTVGSAGYWRNLQHTGHLLGNGEGRLQHESDGSLSSTLITSYRIAYRLLDLSGLYPMQSPSGRAVFLQALTVAGITLAAVVYMVIRHRGVAMGRALRVGLLSALPLLSPVIIVAGAEVMKSIVDATGMNVHSRVSTSSSFVWGVNVRANEDFSYLGFLGAGLAFGCVVVVALGATGRVPHRIAVLALSFPLFVGLLAFQSSYNEWLGRFMLVPLALALPLVAYCWEQPFRVMLAAFAAVTALGTSLTNERKPFESEPWTGSRDQALRNVWSPQLANSTRALEQRLQSEKCVVAVVTSNEPSYLLYGPRLERRVAYAHSSNPMLGGTARVVFGPGADVSAFVRAGWRVEPVLHYWKIARPPPKPLSATNENACGQ
jgi:hypothetical protein